MAQHSPLQRGRQQAAPPVPAPLLLRRVNQKAFSMGKSHSAASPQPTAAPSLVAPSWTWLQPPPGGCRHPTLKPICGPVGLFLCSTAGERRVGLKFGALSDWCQRFLLSRYRSASRGFFCLEKPLAWGCSIRAEGSLPFCCRIVRETRNQTYFPG